MDRIEITGWRALTVIGALDFEQLAPQPIEVDAVLHVDLEEAGETDDLSATGVLSQLWATPGATQTTGRWIGINAYPGSGGARWSPASYRTATLGIDVAVTPPTSATAPTVLSYALGSTLIRLESFGFALDELAEALLAISPSTSSDIPRGIVVNPAGFPGMELRYAGAYDWRQSLIGTTQVDLVATRSYDRQYGWIEVTVGAPVADRNALLPFLIGAPTPFLSADGSLGVAGTPKRVLEQSVGVGVGAPAELVEDRRTREPDVVSLDPAVRRGDQCPVGTHESAHGPGGQAVDGVPPRPSGDQLLEVVEVA